MMSVCTKDSLICFGDRGEGECDWCVRGDFHECYNFLLLNFLLLLFLFFWFNFFFLSFYIFRRLWAPAAGATTFNRGDFHFINLLHFFVLFCFQLLLIILFFLYLFFFYPRYLPTLTTSTHYPRNLATLGCVGEFCSGGRRFKGPE